MRPLSSVFLLSLLSFGNNLAGQSILDLFKLVPIEFTAEISAVDKDSLIKNGSSGYYVGDTSFGYYGSIDTADRALSLELSSRGPGILSYSFKAFVSKEDTLLIIGVLEGASRGISDILALQAWQYYNGTLTPLNECGLAQKIPPSEFFTTELPEWLKLEEIEINPEYHFLTKDANTVIYSIDPRDDRLNPYLITKRFSFTWDGSGFQRQVNKSDFRAPH